MLNNYIKIAFRNLIKYKKYSILNIAGLAVSLACVIFILQWVRYELSYDNFHKNADQTYRIISDFHNNSSKWASTPGPLAPALEQELPQVLKATRFRAGNRSLFRNQDVVMYEDGVGITDSSFFNIFKVSFIAGNPDNALNTPDKIVLTESFAQKYFGTEDPLHRQIEVNSDMLTVSGVIKDFPKNSHIQFRALTSFERAEKQNELLAQWTRNPIYTYVLLAPQTNLESVSNSITALIQEHTPHTSIRTVELQPLKSIHFTTDLFNDDSITIDRIYITLFLVIAGFIMLISCINYMNISTAQYSNRTKEIGLKKVIGASRKEIIVQYLNESLMITFLSLLVAVFIVLLAAPVYESLLNAPFTISLNDPRFYFSLLGILVLTGLLAGSYPAFYLSSISPNQIFRQTTGMASRVNFRHVLTIIQFSLSIALIVGMVVVNQQVHYLLTKSLGFDKENTLCVQINRGIDLDYESLQNELLQEATILGVAKKNSSPEEIIRATQAVSWKGKDPEERIMWELSWIDDQYIPGLNIEMMTGRNFSQDFPSDIDNAVIINETGLKQMGITDPIGKQIQIYGTQMTRTIVGVIKDANFHSLHNMVEPQIYLPITDAQVSDMGTTILVRTNNRIDESIKAITNVWGKRVPNYPLQFTFLDDRYERFYQLENKIRLLFNGFTVFAIFISCLGLFGFVSFMTEKRTKEIGIRKILGAPLHKILMLLLSGFVKRTLISTLIAWPIAWLVMNKWLYNFAYRIDLTFWPFIIAGVAAMAITLLTVGFQLVRATTADPVKALRYE